MVAFSQFKKYTEWLEAVARLAGKDFNYYLEWYSFETAYEDGKSPVEVFNDCDDWMNS